VGAPNPAQCGPAFAWLRAAGLPSPCAVERRARALLATGNTGEPRQLAAELPVEQAAPLLQWAALIEQPARPFDALIANPAQPAEAAALLDGWSRLARKDPDGAIARYDALTAARGLRDPPATAPGAASATSPAAPYAAALGLGLALSRRPDAERYFAMAGSPC